MTVALLFNKDEIGDWNMASLSRDIAHRASYRDVDGDFRESYS